MSEEAPPIPDKGDQSGSQQRPNTHHQQIQRQHQNDHERTSGQAHQQPLSPQYHQRQHRHQQPASSTSLQPYDAPSHKPHEHVNHSESQSHSPHSPRSPYEARDPHSPRKGRLSKSPREEAPTPPQKAHTVARTSDVAHGNIDSDGHVSASGHTSTSTPIADYHRQHQCHQSQQYSTLPSAPLMAHHSPHGDGPDQAPHLESRFSVASALEPHSPQQPLSPQQNQAPPQGRFATHKLLFALKHKPTLSRTWAKKSYLDEVRTAPLAAEHPMEMSDMDPHALRPTSFYASPADLAAFRPLPSSLSAPPTPAARTS